MKSSYRFGGIREVLVLSHPSFHGNCWSFKNEKSILHFCPLSMLYSLYLRSGYLLTTFCKQYFQKFVEKSMQTILGVGA